MCRRNPPQQRIASIGLRMQVIADQRNDMLHLPRQILPGGATVDLQGTWRPEVWHPGCFADRGEMAIETIRHDVKLALRTLRRDRRVAAIAVGSLAFGIAANTTIFSLV